jgi:hypothetical protein
MKSAVATTLELDDAEETARQLADGIAGKLALARHSLGILLCDADTDGAAVTGELGKLMGIDVIGMTTLAPLDPSGRREAAAVLTVLTADDCMFSSTVSDSLANGDYKQTMSRAYEELAAKEAEKPVLALTFCSFGLPFSGDNVAVVLSEATGGIPLMGGMASDDYDYERARVFYCGKEHRDAVVIALLRGNVKPVFALRHVTSRFAERIRRVTEAEGNVVRKVGDETFISYLEGFGLQTKVTDPLLAFTPYPMMLKQENEDETPLMRHISGLNHADGSGTFFGDVPVGAQANICLITKKDIVDGCRESMKTLLEEAGRQSAYAFSTVLCFSCCGRAVILGADANAEGEALAHMLPEGLAFTGAYCLGEICPTWYKDGRASNRFHNCSITFCMF